MKLYTCIKYAERFSAGLLHLMALEDFAYTSIPSISSLEGKERAYEIKSQNEPNFIPANAQELKERFRCDSAVQTPNNLKSRPLAIERNGVWQIFKSTEEARCSFFWRQDLSERIDGVHSGFDEISKP